MKFGFYSPEIGGATVREVFARAKEWGFSTMQYDFSTSHGDTVPAVITDESVAEIAAAAKEFGMQIEAINGTLNMIDVNKERREENLRRFPQIAKAAKALDCRIITLCTGSRNPESGWRYHPDSLLPVHGRR